MKLRKIVMGGVFALLMTPIPVGANAATVYGPAQNSVSELSNLRCCVLRTPPYSVPRPTVSPAPSMVVLVGSSKFALQ
jgi:hypothetical protein